MTLKCIFCYLAAFSLLFINCFAFGQEVCDPYSTYFYDRGDFEWANDVTFSGNAQQVISKLSCHCMDQSRESIRAAIETERTPFEVKVCKLSVVLDGITAAEALNSCSRTCSQFPGMPNPALF